MGRLTFFQTDKWPLLHMQRVSCRRKDNRDFQFYYFPHAHGLSWVLLLDYPASNVRYWHLTDTGLRGVNVCFGERTWRLQCEMSAYDPKRTLSATSVDLNQRRTRVIHIETKFASDLPRLLA